MFPQCVCAIVARVLSSVKSFGFHLSLSLDLFPHPSCQFEDFWPQPSGSGSGSGMVRVRRFLSQHIPNSCPARHLQCTREDWWCPCLPHPRPRNMRAEPQTDMPWQTNVICIDFCHTVLTFAKTEEKRRRRHVESFGLVPWYLRTRTYMSACVNTRPWLKSGAWYQATHKNGHFLYL